MAIQKRNIAKLEGPKGHFIYGSLKEFRTKPLEFCSRMESEYDRICKLNLGPVKVILLHDPDLIKEVLVVQNKSFGKGAQYNQFKLFLNDGLLTSEGETWFKQRRLVQPTFYKKYYDNGIIHINDLFDNKGAILSVDKIAGKIPNTIAKANNVTAMLVSRMLKGILYVFGHVYLWT